MVILLCLTHTIFTQNAPPTLVLNGSALAKNKQEIVKNKDAAKKNALKSFLNDADKIVKRGKFQVVIQNAC